MSQDKAQDLLADVATALAEPDPSVPEVFMEPVDKLREVLELGTVNPAVHQLLSQALVHLEQVVNEASDNVAGDLAAASRLVEVATTAPAPAEVPAVESARGADDDDNQEEIPVLELEDDPELIDEFLSESAEYLADAEAAILELEGNPDDLELVDTVFRAFHTIKGVAAFLGLDPIAEFAHKAEFLLSGARDQEVRLTGGYSNLALQSVDMLQALARWVEQGAKGRLPKGYGALLNVLRDPRAAGVSEDTTAVVATAPVTESAVAAEVEPPPGLVSEASEIEHGWELDSDSEPEVMSPDAAFEGAANSAGDSVSDARAEALADDASPSGGVADAGRTSASANEEMLRPLAVSPVEAAPAPETSAPETARPAPKPPSAAPAPSVDTAKAKGKGARSGSAEATVRVHTTRLDELIDSVGELVIAQSMVAEDSVVNEADNRELQKKVTHAGKIVRELQDLTMALRMVPMAATFQKMNRVVRDVARKSGKEVELVTDGNETEIDRNMVDVVADPLVHMIRNAVDHGIEQPAERVEAGKPARGTIRLAASHSQGAVAIELKDDGRGLDREKIAAKAISRGLIENDKGMSDSDVLKLIFEPGFSTADKVTDISGRGVGMDVVRRGIESLKGSIDIQSELGKGTTFSIKLPLTLAITDGMLVRVGAQRYIIPTSNISMSMRPKAEDLATVSGRGELVVLREDLVPIFRLHQVFGVEGAVTDPSEAILVVINDRDGYAALLVDELLGKQQVVTKSLGEGFSTVPGISGGCILGDGKVGLILDPSGVLALGRGLEMRNGMHTFAAQPLSM